MAILVLHGPNLNLLGTREPGVYGSVTLAQIDEELNGMAAEAGVARHDDTQAIVINPAACTHTSVALRDALAAVALPFIEVDLSNIHRREPFRHHLYFSDLAEGVICGLGAAGYRLALAHLLERTRS